MKRAFNKTPLLLGFYNDHSYCKNIEETNKILQPDIYNEIMSRTVDENSKLFFNESCEKVK